MTGIYHGASALEADAIIMPLDQMQQLTSLQGKVSTVHVRLRPAPRGEAWDRYMKHTEAEIEAAVPGLRAMPAGSAPATIKLSGWPTLPHGAPLRLPSSSASWASQTQW